MMGLALRQVIELISECVIFVFISTAYALAISEQQFSSEDIILSFYFWATALIFRFVALQIPFSFLIRRQILKVINKKKSLLECGANAVTFLLSLAIVSIVMNGFGNLLEEGLFALILVLFGTVTMSPLLSDKLINKERIT